MINYFLLYPSSSSCRIPQESDERPQKPKGKDNVNRNIYIQKLNNETVLRKHICMLLNFHNLISYPEKYLVIHGQLKYCYVQIELSKLETIVILYNNNNIWMDTTIFIIRSYTYLILLKFSANLKTSLKSFSKKKNFSQVSTQLNQYCIYPWPAPGGQQISYSGHDEAVKLASCFVFINLGKELERSSSIYQTQNIYIYGLIKLWAFQSMRIEGAHFGNKSSNCLQLRRSALKHWSKNLASAHAYTTQWSYKTSIKQ